MDAHEFQHRRRRRRAALFFQSLLAIFSTSSDAGLLFLQASNPWNCVQLCIASNFMPVTGQGPFTSRYRHRGHLGATPPSDAMPRVIASPVARQWGDVTWQQWFEKKFLGGVGSDSHFTSKPMMPCHCGKNIIL